MGGLYPGWSEGGGGPVGGGPWNPDVIFGGGPPL